MVACRTGRRDELLEEEEATGRKWLDVKKDLRRRRTKNKPKNARDAGFT